MNTDPFDLTAALKKFICDEEAKVAILKGDWGIGKTYFWRKFVDKHFTESNCKAYSYVSLFGLRDAAEIRHQIFANTNGVIADERNPKKWLPKSVAEKIKFLKNNLSKIEVPWTSSGLRAACEFGAVENYLICFDDLGSVHELLDVRTKLDLIEAWDEEIIRA